MPDTLSTTPTLSINETESSALPEIPEYIDGAFVHNYIAACSTEVQERFANLCARSRIEIPNNTDTLRTEQRELFMEAI